MSDLQEGLELTDSTQDDRPYHYQRTPELLVAPQGGSWKGRRDLLEFATNCSEIFFGHVYS